MTEADYERRLDRLRRRARRIEYGISLVVALLTITLVWIFF